MTGQDIRWIQRFNHFSKALAQLQEATALAQARPLSRLEEQGLIQALAKIHAILARYPQVKQAILYGSRAKGHYKNGSDIDLTLLGGDDLTREVLYRIMDEIDELLLPYTFDLSILREIDDPDVIEHIQREGVVFYEQKGSPE